MLSMLGSPMYVHDWSVEDVVKWLGSHGLNHCASAFRENRITGDVLLDIGREDLAEMGVCALGDRMRVVKAIEQLRVDTMHVAGSAAGPSTLDFFFLGASPLVAVNRGGVRPLELIDLEAEQHAINKALIDAGRICRFQFEFATLRRLTWATLQRSCSVLIFSGHTLPNGHWLLETDTGEALSFDPYDLFHRDETSALGQGALNRQTSMSSETALRPTGAPSLAVDGAGAASGTSPSSAARSVDMCLRLVVLCSCHSSIPASLFIDAGVPHVIAVERSETVLDVSARVFVQSLCHSLLVGNTIQSAFRHAQWLVNHNECLHTAGQKATAKKEAQKFVLLPQGANHATVLFPSQARGRAADCSAARPPVQFPRTRLDLTIIRQVELWKVLKAIRHQRFVQVVGPPGSGKRTLVCLVAHYVWQRHLFPEGIHYIHVDDLRWIVALDWSFHRLFQQGAQEGDSPPIGAGAGSAASTWQVYHDSFLDQRLSLPGYRLLILDGCHGLYQKCRKAFIQWLSTILKENPHLQVLITGRTPVRGALGAVRKEEPLSPGGAREEGPPEGIIEVGELSAEDAVRLLRWRCNVLPEAAAFLEEHGQRLVELCGRLPMALCVCARWLVAQLPRTDPRRMLEAMEDEAQRLEVLRPCASVLDAAVAALPEALRQSLPILAELHSSFGVDVAATLWDVEASEAELRLEALREHHLLEATGSTEALYRMQPLLRLHLRHRPENRPEARVQRTARVVAGYATRVASAAARREEFPNIQLALDLSGATSSFLVLLWAARSVRWIHTWLGDARRERLYERALAVLAVLPGGEGERGPREGVPSDVFLGAAPGDAVDPGRAEAALRRLVEVDAAYRAEASWEEQWESVLCDGSNVDPAEVWGSALGDPSQPLVRAMGELDGAAMPLIRTARSAAALADDLAQPAMRNRWVCEALLELSVATRATDPLRAMRLAHCAAARLVATSSAGDVAAWGSTELRPLLADAVAEFSLSCLALRGLGARTLTAELLDLSASLGQSCGLTIAHFRALRRCALHALAFERDPCKAERLQKRCLELKLQKFNTWQHPEIAETLGDCGVLCFILGDNAHAESMLRTSVSVWRQLSKRGSRLASALVELADLSVVKEAWADAESFYTEALSMLVEGSDGVQVLQAMSRLAMLHQRRGRPDAAIPLLRDCLASMLRSGGKARAGEAMSLGEAAVRHNLAACLLSLGQAAPQPDSGSVEEALGHLQRASGVYRSQLPPSSPSALALRRSLARCHLRARDPEEAVAVLEPALRMMELGAPTVQELGKMHLLLGRARLMQKEVQKSRRHFEWVLSHPAVADSLSEAERLAAEDLVHRGSALDEDAKAKVQEPAELAPAESAEPQVEPAPAFAEEGSIGSLAAGAKRGGSALLHFSFGDVDIRTLSVLNRVPYLMEGRIKESLSVNPPMGDFHVATRGEEAVAIHDASSIDTPIGLEAALERMGAECARRRA